MGSLLTSDKDLCDYAPGWIHSYESLTLCDSVSACANKNLLETFADRSNYCSVICHTSSQEIMLHVEKRIGYKPPLNGAILFDLKTSLMESRVLAITTMLPPRG